MDLVIASLPLWIWLVALGVALLAGLIKGMVGFALPTVLISGLGSFMSPELALAGLILPTLATNIWLALRDGVRIAGREILRYKVFLLVGFLAMLISAQLVPLISAQAMFLLIGTPLTLYACLGLAGRPLRLRKDHGVKTEGIIGAVAGFLGGISGAWGPPTVAMLTAQNTEKKQQVRIQGVIYSLGAVTLLGAHIGSGVLRLQTLPLSVMLVIPSMAGVLIGLRINDRIDQRAFRILTLFVLLIAGLNMIRRGL